MTDSMQFEMDPITATLEASDAERERAKAILAGGKMSAATLLMDDDLRETIHSSWPPRMIGYEGDFAFLLVYSRLHSELFGESFAPLSGGAW